MEFDEGTRRSRVIHFPDEYVSLESAVGSEWLTRREMFERVDAALKAQATSEVQATSPQTRLLGPVIVVALALSVLCIMLGAVASAFVISPSLARTRRAISVAYQPTPTATITATPSVVATPAPVTQAITSPLEGAVPSLTPTLQVAPIVTATQAPTQAAQVTPAQPVQTPLPPTLPAVNSPLPTAVVTLPPTFTPVPATQAAAATPTIAPTSLVTATPTVVTATTSPDTSTTPTVTAGVATQPPPGSVITATTTPTITETPVPSGSVVFPVNTGNIQVRALQAVGTGPNQADEYVEIYNGGTQQVSIDGWSVKAIRSSDNVAIDTYLFQNGAIIAAGQACRIYTNAVLTTPEDCASIGGQTGGFASSQQIWPDGGGARASLFNQQNIEQARYTY